MESLKSTALQCSGTNSRLALIQMILAIIILSKVLKTLLSHYFNDISNNHGQKVLLLSQISIIIFLFLNFGHISIQKYPVTKPTSFSDLSSTLYTHTSTNYLKLTFKSLE